MKIRHAFLGASVILAVLATGVPTFARAEPPLPVLINARHSETKLEKRHRHPTPDKPVYYFPIAGGFLQRGPAIAGEEPLTFKETWPLLRKALASQGYLMATKDSPTPTLILTLHWGAMNPDRVESQLRMSDGEESEPESAGEVILNMREMLILTGGAHNYDSHLQFEQDVARERASEDRYFVIITAYDMAAAMEPKRRKQHLWNTILSVPSARTSLAASIGPMLTAGASSIGRHQEQPTEVDIALPQGRVDIGTPIVVDHPTESAPKRR